ncbi:hypothetical protein SAMN05421766_101103 [Zobellia uliginosa]|uniref:Secreted protein n=1 Tax=Zobellia uliginosa TaxID=143224 RepID=A0ABY1KKC5_9FLAO|nr:hypothetical protein SAMN05421766_101103 [Zobellia uliginosa]
MGCFIILTTKFLTRIVEMWARIVYTLTFATNAPYNKFDVEIEQKKLNQKVYKNILFGLIFRGPSSTKTATPNLFYTLQRNCQNHRYGNLGLHCNYAIEHRPLVRHST